MSCIHSGEPSQWKGNISNTASSCGGIFHRLIGRTTRLLDLSLDIGKGAGQLWDVFRDIYVRGVDGEIISNRAVGKIDASAFIENLPLPDSTCWTRK